MEDREWRRRRTNDAILYSQSSILAAASLWLATRLGGSRGRGFRSGGRGSGSRIGDGDDRGRGFQLCGRGGEIDDGAAKKAIGAKRREIPLHAFGGAVAVQLVGKHVDSTVNNPIEAGALLEWAEIYGHRSGTPEASPLAQDPRIAWLCGSVGRP